MLSFTPFFASCFAACQIFLSIIIVILLFYYLDLTYSLPSYHLFFYLYAIWFDCCSPTLLSFSCHLRSLFHHFFPTLYTSTFIFCFPFLKEYSTTLYCCLHLSFFSPNKKPTLWLYIHENLLSFTFLFYCPPLFFLLTVFLY